MGTNNRVAMKAIKCKDYKEFIYEVSHDLAKNGNKDIEFFIQWENGTQKKIMYDGSDIKVLYRYPFEKWVEENAEDVWDDVNEAVKELQTKPEPEYEPELYF